MSTTNTTHGQILQHAPYQPGPVSISYFDPMKYVSGILFADTFGTQNQINVNVFLYGLPKMYEPVILTTWN